MKSIINLTSFFREVLQHIEFFGWNFMNMFRFMTFFTIHASFFFFEVFFFVLLAFHEFWGFIFREIFSSFKIFTIPHRSHRLGQNSKKKNAFSVYKSCTIFFWLKVYLPFLKEHLALYLEGMKSLLDWNLIVTRVHRMIYWYLFNKIIVSYVKSIENYKSLGLCGALTTMPLSHILFS